LPEEIKRKAYSKHGNISDPAIKTSGVHMTNMINERASLACDLCHRKAQKREKNYM
jgi:hypothetical protein